LFFFKPFFLLPSFFPFFPFIVDNNNKLSLKEMSSLIDTKKSILKQNTLSRNNSWLSKFNLQETTTQPRSFFNKVTKRQQQEDQIEDKEQQDELSPKELKRAHFPVAQLTTEFKFNKQDIIQSKKKVMEKDEINIQTTGQLLSVYQTACRNIQEPPLELFVSILDVSFIYL
jgi:hypothetical protein